jgi:hypothetical protein
MGTICLSPLCITKNKKNYSRPGSTLPIETIDPSCYGCGTYMHQLEPVQLAHQCVTINPPVTCRTAGSTCSPWHRGRGSPICKHTHIKKGVVGHLKGGLQRSRKCVLVELRSGNKSTGLGPRLTPNGQSRAHRRPVACRRCLLRPMK